MITIIVLLLITILILSFALSHYKEQVRKNNEYRPMATRNLKKENV